LDDPSILCFGCFIFGLVWFFFSLSFYVPGVFRPNIDTARKLTSIVYIITPVLWLAPLNNSRYMWYSYVNGRGKHLDVIGLVSEKKTKMALEHIHFVSAPFPKSKLYFWWSKTVSGISDRTERYVSISSYTLVLYILNSAMIIFITRRRMIIPIHNIRISLCILYVTTKLLDI